MQKSVNQSFDNKSLIFHGRGQHARLCRLIANIEPYTLEYMELNEQNNLWVMDGYYRVDCRYLLKTRL